MAFNPKNYEGQIRAILQAPDVDLSTISAKRVRKQLVEDNAELTTELVKENKDDIDALISQVYEQVSGTGEAGVEEDNVSEQGKRKREDEEFGMSATPKKAKKETKKDSHLSDAELARQLSQEINGRDRATRAKGPAKPKAKRAKKNAKSSATVDSDGEGSSVADGLEKPKRKGGFTKEYMLSDKLASLLDVERLSRPQVVKRIWDYIKANKLQNPEDKREILCDDRMKSIFGVERINMFKMNKQLGEHLFEPTAA
ncbi:SWIB/MDM2 domain-containing protein [Irpex rosettiformis]|uniref:SWIB/MDM2 domain-containing protein n=1 Tax=Irpex rosettiformis TaxID=378272 RepID=A0ACB8U915_9APHY|nr:SWIB/MDM2 domain-containing protein [Irpex rosettiformis]